MNRRLHACSRFFTALILLLLIVIPPASLAAPASPSIPLITSWISQTVDSASSAGTHASIAVDPDQSERPYIAYFSETDDALRLAHPISSGTGNCGPGNSWRCEVVDQANGEIKGMFNSIAIYPDTNPDPLLSTWKIGISYFDSTHRSLKYAEYSCPHIICFWRVDTVQEPDDPEGLAGRYTSLQFRSTGTPVIAYQNMAHHVPFNTFSVRHAYYLGDGAGDCGTDNDWRCTTVDSTDQGTMGMGISLDLSYDDRPYIAYHDGHNDSLKYATYASFGNCGDGDAWQCTTVDDRPATDVGAFPAMNAPQFAEAGLLLAYYNQTDGKLMYAQPTSQTGNCGETQNWLCHEIDDMGPDLTQAAISLATTPSGGVRIAYTSNNEFPFSRLDLKYAQPAVHQPYANCGDDMYGWYCSTIAGGDVFRDVGAFAGLAFNSNGQALVAYSIYDDFDADYDLQFALSALNTYLPMAAR